MASNLTDAMLAGPLLADLLAYVQNATHAVDAGLEVSWAIKRAQGAFSVLLMIRWRVCGGGQGRAACLADRVGTGLLLLCQGTTQSYQHGKGWRVLPAGAPSEREACQPGCAGLGMRVLGTLTEVEAGVTTDLPLPSAKTQIN